MMQEVDDDGQLAPAGTPTEVGSVPPGPAEVPELASASENPEGGAAGNAVTDANRSEEDDQKAALINQVLELQNTLDELSGRVNRVKEENAKLKSENEVLTQYIENLMASSTVIQTTSGQAAGSTGTKKSISSLWSSLGGKKT